MQNLCKNTAWQTTACESYQYRCNQLPIKISIKIYFKNVSTTTAYLTTLYSG